MEFYAGDDLHANNNFLGIADETGRRVFKKRLPNDLEAVLEALDPWKDGMAGIVVESTFNWYWLVDGLMGAGYTVHLANPAANQQYSGLKYLDDQYDSFWLADLLRLKILKEGYIYPKEIRPVRDLLRKRGHLVRLRTALLLSLKNTITRNLGIRLSANDIKHLTEDRVSPFLEGNADIALSGKVSKEVIDFMSLKIKEVEGAVLKKSKSCEPYKNLLLLPGIGKILSLTISLETGPIVRFVGVGNYTSYCRKVKSRWMSNGKVKGGGNSKCGNKYLAWAYSEAAELARRSDQAVRAWYNRKLNKTNAMVAHNAVARKLVRAAYFIIRDGVEYQPHRLFF